MDSNFSQSRRLVRSHRRPDRVASLLKDAPLPMLNQSDAQTEDGHAMMKSDTFQSFQDLSHAVRGCHNSVLSLRVEQKALLLKVEQKGRHKTTVDNCVLTSQLAHASHQRPVGKW